MVMLPYLFGTLLLFATTAPAAPGLAGLAYSTYLRDGFTPSAIVTDPAGNVYVTGSTIVDPATSQTAAMVVKLDPAGAQYLYVRAFGGSASDVALGIAVDSSGNAYVTGTASSPDFPITPSAQTGTLPSANQTRAFLVKLNPQGEPVFSDVLASVPTSGLAVALASDGGILVSGTSGAGLAASSGAYSVANTNNRPFLMKLDASGSNIVFTATGIGGNALALDSAGNIYMAGSTTFTDYPTTPGAYQPVLNAVEVCFFPCQLAFPGTNQYLTKVDPAASKLIYSTGVAGASQTVNNGLAVDAAGNAYVTGVAYGEYNWTVSQMSTSLVEPLLTKIDPAGAKALYSIQIGGAGVALGAQGDVYVGGAYNDINLSTPGLPLPPLPLGVANLPTPCQENNITTFSEGYVSHVDAATGNVLSTVLVDGSNVSMAGIAFASGSSLWLAGPTSRADTPITPGALTPIALHAGALPGAYLGEANFALSSSAVPQISCVVDAGNGARAGVVAPGELLTLFGSGLGPNDSTISPSGVTVTFDGTPAPLLYVSATQINVAVPPALSFVNAMGFQNFPVMQVSVNGVAAPPRELPVVPSNPSVFADLSGTILQCTIGANTFFGAFTDFALNADGSANSCLHRATPGSVVSFFVNGLGVNFSYGNTQPWVASQIPIAVTIGAWSAEVVNVTAPTPFVWQVDVVVPTAVEAAAQGGLSLIPVTMDMNFMSGVAPVGPLTVEPFSPSYATAGSPFPLSIWVSP
jgi:uncharacterized protein (TIGR03437 family)